MGIHTRDQFPALLMALLCATGAAAYAAAPTSADPGQLAFNNTCRTCHSTKEGDNRLGPSLAHIVGQKAGTRSGYSNYSQAMRGAGITWDEQTLDRFIANPESVAEAPSNQESDPFALALE